MTQCVIISPGRAPLDTALAGLPGRCDGAVVDTRSEADVAALFARAGELDHLVYSAGDALGPRPLKDLSLDEARQLFEVRFWGAVAAVKHAAPRVRPGGSIVLTSGTVGVRPAPGGALAASGASAIEGLTRGLAVELAPIRVNAVRPGVIRTPMWARSLSRSAKRCSQPSPNGRSPKRLANRTRSPRPTSTCPFDHSALPGSPWAGSHLGIAAPYPFDLAA